MTDEKPLHVKVAEALGCKLVQQEGGVRLNHSDKPSFYWACGCKNDGHDFGPHGSRFEGVYEYDKSWLFGGPLIEKYGIAVAWLEHYQGSAWWAKPTAERTGREVWFEDGDEASGPTPLVAVCHLIIALHEAGKLAAPSKE